jgi:predicted nucleic acid-binding protein
VGILVRAAQEGIAGNLKEVLEELRKKGIRISDEVIEHALILADENGS